MWAMSRCEVSGAPTSSPNPGSTLSTPSGRPASAASAASPSGLIGACSEGLSTRVFPAASAGAASAIMRTAGTFQAMIRAQTPSGWRSV